MRSCIHYVLQIDAWRKWDFSNWLNIHIIICVQQLSINRTKNGVTNRIIIQVNRSIESQSWNELKEKIFMNSGNRKIFLTLTILFIQRKQKVE